MGHFKALSFASAFLLATAGAAAAADLLPPPPPAEPVVEEFSGWYIRGDVGVGINSMTSWKSTFNDATFNPKATYTDIRKEQTSLGDSTFLRLGAGYQFNNWFRADITGEYRTAASYNATESYKNVAFTPSTTIPGGGCGGPAAYNYDGATGVLTAFANGAAQKCYDKYTASVRSTVVLANGYVDLGTWYNLTPYVGAGIGAAYHTFSGITDQGNSSGFGIGKSASKTNLAWALMTGVAYSVTPNLKLEVGYRYLNMGTLNSSPITCNVTAAGSCHFEVQHFKLASSDIHIGMRWLIGANAQGNGQALYWGENGATSGTLVQGAGGSYAAGTVGHPGQPLVRRY